MSSTPGGTAASRGQRLALVSCALLTLLIFFSLGSGLRQGLVFETDLRALLPEAETDSLAQAAGERLFEFGSDRIVLLLEVANRQTAIEAANDTEQWLQGHSLLGLEQAGQRAAQSATMLQALTEYRFFLLTEAQRQALAEQPPELLAQSALRDLYSPRGWGRSLSPQLDPLGLLEQFQQAQQDSQPELELAGEHLILRSAAYPDHYFALFTLRLAEDALDLNSQQAVVRTVDELEGVLQTTYPDLRVLRSGIVFHAAAAAKQARSEIATIGIGSGIGIIALYLATFASLRPLLMSLASLAFGSACALALCHYVFGTVHLLTLVFGAALTGVAIDYSLHYYTRAYGSRRDTSGLGTLQGVLPGIGLGLLTSLIGYGSLAQAPLPGLRQVAVFSVAGLASAWLFVVAFYPIGKTPAPRSYPRFLQHIADAPWSIWRGRRPLTLVLTMTCVGILGALICRYALTVADDARALYAPSANLLAQEQQVRILVGNFSANQFFLINGNDEQSLLEREEQLAPILDGLVAQGAISAWQAVSQQLPSIHRQRTNYLLQQSAVYGEEGAASHVFSALGVGPETSTKLQAAMQAADGHYLQPGEWLSLAADDQALPWLGQHGGGYASMVTLQDVADLDALKKAAASLEDVQFVDRVGEISLALQLQREKAGRLLGLAYGCVLALLLLRYRQPQAMLLPLAPMLASVVTLAILSLAGESLTLFHVFALFLVLGLGMDYSIFAREMGPEDGDCRLAIMLSAFTSSLSFGLLAMSSTPMVHAFGITVLLGSLLNLLLVPGVTGLAMRSRQ